MKPYSRFANIYDEFMEDAPNDQWLRWLTDLFPDLSAWDVVDLGCGTGIVAVELALRSRRVIGLDASETMLAQAAQSGVEKEVNVLWTCQDIREFELDEPVQLAISTCDVVNYLSGTEDLQRFVQRVAAALSAGGWFCFDVLGPSRFERLANGFWYDLQPHAAILFETDVDGPVISYDVNMFVAEHEDNTYQRYEEHHEQTYYSLLEIQACLEQNGFVVIHVRGDFGESSTVEADRVCIAAQKRADSE